MEVERKKPRGQEKRANSDTPALGTGGGAPVSGAVPGDHKQQLHTSWDRALQEQEGEGGFPPMGLREQVEVWGFFGLPG